MDLEFAFIVLCIVALAAFDLLAGPKERLSFRALLLDRLTRAGREGTLGPPRFKTYCGELYVIGCGRRYLVRTRDEGYRLIARMKREMEKTLEARPPAERNRPIVLL